MTLLRFTPCPILTAVAALCWLVGLPLTGSAQVAQPHITIDGSVGLGGPRSFTEPHVTITEAMGELQGANLFHSFGRFSIPSAGSATFTGTTAGIARVIGRVTGGEVSSINGTLASTIPGADVFLINPAGVIFGSGARLNVGGSFRVSTADYLKMTDGSSFHADLGRASTLTTASAADFGFLNRPAPHVVASIQATTGSSLQVPVGKTIALVGGEVTLAGPASAVAPTVQARSGRIELIAVASEAEVPAASVVGDPAPTLDGVTTLGPVSLTGGARVFALAGVGNATPGGQTIVRGDRLTVDNALMTVSTGGNQHAPAVSLDLAVRNGLVVDHSATVTSNNTTGTGTAGEVRMVAGSLDVMNDAAINVLYAGAGKGSDLTIQADTVQLTTGGTIVARNDGINNQGNGGTVNIQAGEQLFIGAESSITTNNSRGLGTGSPVQITTPSFIVEGGSGPLEGAGIEGITGGNGPASSVLLSVGSLELRGAQSLINTKRETTTLGGAPGSFGAGPITVQGLGGAGTPAERVLISGPGSGFLTETEGAGVGGPLQVTARTIEIVNGGKVSSFSSGTGDAGPITLTGLDQILLANGTVTTEASQASGGVITLNAAQLIRLTDSTVTASVQGGSQTRGGDIAIDPDFVILENSRIVATAIAGNGGDITIRAGTFLADPSSLVSASSQLGISGTVTIQSPLQNLSEAIAPLPSGFMVVSSLSGQRCAAQKGGQLSSFVLASRDGVAAQPDDYLSSPPLEAFRAGGALARQVAPPATVATTSSTPPMERADRLAALLHSAVCGAS